MPKFFIDNESIDHGTIEITGQDAVHISSVLRYGKGDKINVCAGMEYICEIVEAKPKRILLRILEEKPSASEPVIKTTLYQAMPKSDKMELIIQKCVELGICRIVPVITERTVVKPNSKIDQKTERYRKISESAAKQSGRGIVPAIETPVSFLDAAAQMSELDLAFVAYEEEENKRIRDLVKGFNGVTAGILIGPEGGFTSGEIDICKKNNIWSISLGKRVLRTETAGFMALIILLYEMGEF